jgi:hypothetical protein
MPKLSRLKRKDRQRTARTSILIIGEGKTEESYFNAIKQQRYLQSSALNVEIEPTTSKSDPVNLVKKAESRKRTGVYDHIFCVFDGDKAEEARKARQQLARHKDDLRGFISVPCFEVWLTLHFERSDAAMPDCQQAETRLKRHWPAYVKGCGCDSLMSRLDMACDNARWLEQRQHANPCTDLHYLIEVLETALKET